MIDCTNNYSADKTLYKQCKFTRKKEPGVIQYYWAWIPEELAKMGRIINFSDKKFGSGWLIEGVSECTKSYYEVTINSHIPVQQGCCQ